MGGGHCKCWDLSPQMPAIAQRYTGLTRGTMRYRRSAERKGRANVTTERGFTHKVCETVCGQKHIVVLYASVYRLIPVSVCLCRPAYMSVVLQLCLFMRFCLYVYVCVSRH